MSDAEFSEALSTEMSLVRVPQPTESEWDRLLRTHEMSHAFEVVDSKVMFHMRALNDARHEAVVEDAPEVLVDEIQSRYDGLNRYRRALRSLGSDIDAFIRTPLDPSALEEDAEEDVLMSLMTEALQGDPEFAAAALAGQLYQPEPEASAVSPQTAPKPKRVATPKASPAHGTSKESVRSRRTPPSKPEPPASAQNRTGTRTVHGPSIRFGEHAGQYTPSRDYIDWMLSALAVTGPVVLSQAQSKMVSLMQEAGALRPLDTAKTPSGSVRYRTSTNQSFVDNYLIKPGYVVRSEERTLTMTEAGRERLVAAGRTVTHSEEVEAEAAA